MPMDYFRRPQLAGNTLSRPTHAYVRGSVRRKDADGVNAFPYFPGASGKFLNVSIDGVPQTPVAFGGDGIDLIISNINTVLGVAGTASNDDGTIRIQTNTAGAAGSVEVTGGDGAEIVGFFLKGGRVYSVGGDLSSSPEARIGNPFGTAFPIRGENFTAETLRRSVGRICANTDVLYADHLRFEPIPQEIVNTPSLDGKYITPFPSSSKVFTSIGALNAFTPKETLARYFYLIDPVTKLPPASRIVGVVRGTPAGLPPYSNATTWTGPSSVGNVLGQDLEKVSSAITTIRDGRVVSCAGADFVTAKVVTGDYAEIFGATNFQPWSNNGYRWIVEQVVDATTLVLRPMSFADQFNANVFTNSDSQPIVELNSNISGVESYGTLRIKTGGFTNDVNLVVDPPIPSGASYTLYAAAPATFRSRRINADLNSRVGNGDYASDEKILPNELLQQPTIVTWNANFVSVSTGLARFSGRVVGIPARIFPAADFASGDNYLYWDRAANAVKISSSPVLVLNSDPAQAPGTGFPGDTQTFNEPIAVVTKSGSNLTSLSYEGRSSGETARALTVGNNSQFLKLSDAVNYVNTWAVGNNFRTTTYPQFEIVVTSDQVINAQTLSVVVPVRIRGARPDVTLSFTNHPGGNPITLGGPAAGSTVIESLTMTFDSSYAATNVFTLSNTLSRVIFREVNASGSYSGFVTGGGGTSSRVIFDNCKIQGWQKSFIAAGNINTSYEVSRCDVSISNTPVTAPSAFGLTSGSFACKSLTVRDSEITVSTDQAFAGAPAISVFNTTTLIDRCRFIATGSGSNSVLFKTLTGDLTISNCKSSSILFVAASGAVGDHCVVENCIIDTTFDSGSFPTLRATVARGNRVTASGASAAAGAVIASQVAEGNIVTLIPASGTGGIGITGTPQVLGNLISVAGNSAIGIRTTLKSVVADNVVLISSTGTNRIGIDAQGDSEVSSNIIDQHPTAPPSTTALIAIKLTGTGLQRISHNRDVFTDTSLTIPDGSSAVVIGNDFRDVAFDSATPTFGSGRFFNNKIRAITNFFPAEFVGNFVPNGSSVNSPSGVPLLATHIDNNVFTGNFAVEGGATISQRVSIKGNAFLNVNMLDDGHIDFCDNVVTGTFNVIAQGRFLNNQFRTNNFGGDSLTGTNVIVKGNLFEGAGATRIISGTTAVISDNEFASTVAGLTIGQHVAATSTVFSNNRVRCPISFPGALSQYVSVEDSWFYNGTVTLPVVDKLNGNYFENAAISVAGRQLSTNAFAPAVGNAFAGATGAKSFTRLLMSGTAFEGLTAALDFDSCELAGCDIDFFATAPGCSLTDCAVSASRIRNGDFEVTRVRFDGCHFPTAATLTTNAGGVRVSGSRFDDALTVDTSAASDVQLQSSYVGAALIINQGGTSKVVIDSVTVASTMAVTSQDLTVSGSRISGTGTLTLTGAFRWADTTSLGITCSVSATSTVDVSNSTFGGDVDITNDVATVVSFQGNKVIGRVATGPILSETAHTSVTVVGNDIAHTSAVGASALAIPGVSSSGVISGNRILEDVSSGTDVVSSCIRVCANQGAASAQVAKRLTVSGNTLRYIDGAHVNSASGTDEVCIIHVHPGALVASGNGVGLNVSGNYINFPDNVVTGAHNFNFHALRFNGLVGLFASNLVTRGSTDAALTGNGALGQIVSHNAATTFTVSCLP